MNCPGQLARSAFAAGLFAVCIAFFSAACSPASGDVCADKVCDAGLVCVSSGGEAACAPPADACGASNPCRADERCFLQVDGTAGCLAPDRCRAVTCELGKACDQATGKCTIDRAPCEGVHCREGLECNEQTGKCERPADPCAEAQICCARGFVCDPDKKACVSDLCEITANYCACGPSEVCNSLTGGCDPVPGPCGFCGPTQYCDARTSACLELPTGKAGAGQVGAACSATAECSRAGGAAFCITDGGLFGGMPDGMCSASCDQRACPSGSACIDVGLQRCMDICTSAADCRAGYACEQVDSDNPLKFCFPAAGGGSQCEGSECEPIGGACRENDDCMEGATCQRNLSGGYCVKRGCSGFLDCADGECVCLGADPCSGSTIALATCSLEEQDCRPGYACHALRSTGDEGYCWARQCDADRHCRAEGNACSTALCDSVRGICDAPCTEDAHCSGGRVCEEDTGRCVQPCASSNSWCGPDGRCDVAAGKCVRKCISDATCAAGSYCNLLEGECVPRCTEDSQCKGSEFCDPMGQCRTRCANDNACGSNEYCESGRCVSRCTGAAHCELGEFCAPDTGRCHPDLKSVPVGSACQKNTDCGPFNGRCLTTGHPGGYCVASGCSDADPCGVGAACVTDGGEKRCLKACDPGAAGACRPGYACVDMDGQSVCALAP